MKFTVRIQTPTGGLRTASFESRYDATSVLEDEITRDVLQEGETIAMTPDPHGRGPMDRRKKVPSIERIA